MRTILKLASAAIFAVLGFATTASADDIRFYYGSSPTIIICGTCAQSPARQVTRPQKFEEPVARPVAKPVNRPVAKPIAKPIEKPAHKPIMAKALPPATGTASNLTCLNNGTAMQLKVRWQRPYNAGDCDGYVTAKDFATVAKLAAAGHTKFMIRFNVVHCATGVAKMPAELRNGVLTNRPWDKTCKRVGESDSAFNTRAR
ncbi:MAG: hypothetical protein EON60_10045 [Alphaproteobacteria bacterium]|nr:MAG: hypothetical protein EON60_10045 [Alphaproteobacteria bacterium]